MKASVAILSWNAVGVLERAVRSALEQTYTGVEVVVVDNGSTDGSLKLLPALEALGCRALRNPTNVGYAQGMNLAYAATDGDVFVPMNCDAALHPEFVANAVDVLRDRAQVGIVGALVYRSDGVDPSWCRGPERLTDIDGFVVGLTRSMRTRLLEAGVEVAPSFKANGACPVLRRAAVEQVRDAYGVGPFDPVFDTYGEDIDLAFKAWSLGWKTVASSTVIAAHARSYGERRRIYDRRGRLRVNSIAARHLNAWRHLPTSMLVGTVPRLLAGDLALTARQVALADIGAVGDLRRAWSRVWGLRRDLRSFRLAHRPIPKENVRRIIAGSGH
jgi:GT2 family glycosyltransferase